MTREYSGHYSKKHPAGLKTNPEIAEAVNQKASNGKISCGTAFKIVDGLKIPPREVGITADLMEIPIVQCQLGLFGHEPKMKIIEPAEAIPQDLEHAVRTALMDGRLPCKSAWDIADRFSLRKVEVTSVCEALEVKISACQLGAF